VAVTAFLVAVGLVFVLSASAVASMDVHDSLFHRFERQALFVGLGLVALAVFAAVPTEALRRLSPLMFAGVLTCLVLVFAIGTRVDGSRRWIGPAFMQFQPSELAKLAVIAVGARMLLAVDPRSRAVLRIGALLGTPVLLVVLQPDLGSSVILAVIVVTLLVSAGAPKRLVAAVLAAGFLGLCLNLAVQEYQAERIKGLVEADCSTSQGFHACQSLVGLGTGHLLGTGVGASRAKWGYLPNADSDFIFTVIGEEVGFVGGVLVIAGFAAFTVFGIRTANRARDRYSQVVATAITSWITVQALINIAVTVRWAPVTGVPLPFISIGGTSRVVLLAAVGVLIRIARTPARVPVAAPASGRRGAVDATRAPAADRRSGRR
jgi:cell division protein FtsW